MLVQVSCDNPMAHCGEPKRMAPNAAGNVENGERRLVDSIDALPNKS
jgi:hypothetical protein